MKSSSVKYIDEFIFNNRLSVLIIGGILSVFLGYQALQLKPSASYEKMIPLEHEYIKNYLSHIDDVPSGNSIKIAVVAKSGDIFNPKYLEALRKINDEVFFLPGVDRIGMKSLWTKNTKWNAVTEDGFEGGTVISDRYDGTAETIHIIKSNVSRSGVIGTLVANNFKSTMIVLPLLSIDAKTGKKPDYSELSEHLENIRSKYTDDTIGLHIIGFGKLVGDLIDGIGSIALFFLASVLMTLVLLYLYSHCLRATLLPVFCSLLAVTWQLGLLHLLGIGLDPYSILIPFLIFAIGVSHGVQVVNAVAIESGRGLKKLDAAKMTFRDLAGPGSSALISDAIGFLTLLLIPILVIRELGLGATIGVLILAITNLLILTVLFSYFGISKSGIEHATHRETKEDWFSNLFSNIATKNASYATVALSICLVVVGLHYSQNLKIGDLDKGAPELHADSRYNKDVEFIVNNYSTGSDVLVLMVETGEYNCVAYETLDYMDRLQWRLKQLPTVQNVSSAVNSAKKMGALLNDGNMKWYSIPRSQQAIFSNVSSLPEGLFYNNECNLSLIFVSLDDHKAETLSGVAKVVQDFESQYSDLKVQVLLGAGNAGIALATNEVIEQSQTTILIAVYLVVFLVILITFRSFTAAIYILIPLSVTSVLGQALMTQMGIGVKVATLPVIALGVGIGVDYGIYIYSRIKYYLNKGQSFRTAYVNCLRTTGKAVMFTGLTLAVGVCTWIFSPIKFQTDMGVMLIFMFLWNMVGSLTFMPALLFIHQSVFSKGVSLNTKSVGVNYD